MSGIETYLSAEAEPELERTEAQKEAAQNFLATLKGVEKTAAGKKVKQPKPSKSPRTKKVKTERATPVSKRKAMALEKSLAGARAAKTTKVVSGETSAIRDDSQILPGVRGRISRRVAKTRGPVPEVQAATISFGAGRKPAWKSVPQHPSAKKGGRWGAKGSKRKPVKMKKWAMVQLLREKPLDSVGDLNLEKRASILVLVRAHARQREEGLAKLGSLLRIGEAIAGSVGNVGRAAKASGEAAVAGASVAPRKGFWSSLKHSVFGPGKAEPAIKPTFGERVWGRTAQDTLAKPSKIKGNWAWTDPVSKAQRTAAKDAQTSAAAAVNKDIARTTFTAGGGSTLAAGTPLRGGIRNFDDLTLAYRQGHISDDVYKTWHAKMSGAYSKPLKNLKTFEKARTVRGATGLDDAGLDIAKTFGTAEGKYTWDSILGGLKSQGYTDPEKLIPMAMTAIRQFEARAAAKAAASEATQKKLLIGTGLGVGGLIGLKALSNRDASPRQLPPPGSGYS